MIRPSPIHGLGVFALESIPAGRPIGKTRTAVRGVRISPLGIWTNHAAAGANTFHRIDPQTGEVWIVAARRIGAGEEILSDYAEVYRMADLPAPSPVWR